MRGTFQLPNGVKLRSQSQRRYVVVGLYGKNGATIVRRSDSLTIAQGFARVDHLKLVLDTVTGEVVGK